MNKDKNIKILSKLSNEEILDIAGFGNAEKRSLFEQAGYQTYEVLRDGENLIARDRTTEFTINDYMVVNEKALDSTSVIDQDCSEDTIGFMKRMRHFLKDPKNAEKVGVSEQEYIDECVCYFTDMAKNVYVKPAIDNATKQVGQLISVVESGLEMPIGYTAKEVVIEELLGHSSENQDQSEM